MPEATLELHLRQLEELKGGASDAHHGACRHEAIVSGLISVAAAIAKTPSSAWVNAPVKIPLNPLENTPITV